VIVALLNSSGARSVDGNHLMRFQSETTGLKFLLRGVNGAYNVSRSRESADAGARSPFHFPELDLKLIRV